MSNRKGYRSANYAIPVGDGGSPPIATRQNQHHPDFNLSPSSVRAHRYSDLLETGDYHYPQSSPTPNTGVVRSNNTTNLVADPRRSSMFESDGDGNQQSPRLHHQQHLGRNPSISYVVGGGAGGGGSNYSDVGGLGRSQSIGFGSSHDGGGRSPGGIDTRMAYSPSSRSVETFTSPSSWHIGSDQPPPPQSAARYHHSSPSMSLSISSMPPPPVPRSESMRRGTSYDAGNRDRRHVSPARPASSTNSMLVNPYANQLETSSQMSREGSNSRSETGGMTRAGRSLSISSQPGSNYARPPPPLERQDTYSPSRYAAQYNHIPPPPLSSSSSKPSASPNSASYYIPHAPASSSLPPRSFPPPLSQSPYPQSSTPSHHPQAQPYYQSQRYFDSKLNTAGQISASSASSSSNRSPALASLSTPFYSHTNAPAGPSNDQVRSISRARRNGKGLQRVDDVRNIVRVVNAQPIGRRGDPAGGFLSPLQALTTQLPQTYHLVNPAFRHETSLNPRRVLTKPSKPVGNNGFDNEENEYILYVNDILGAEDRDRYLILDVLGQGTFGQVVKCQNMTTHEIVAVKVIKNKPAYFQQSMMEVTILELINTQYDKDDEHHMLRMKDNFIHHAHLCLVFELLSNNLYELIKQNSFRGLSTNLVRVFTAQLLDALTVLEEAKIIHCDLKPENILLKTLQSPTIKVVDFGSACHERQTLFTYIQSRFYRSPEVILSLPYSAAIDMWSLGCICVELFLGLPLFPGTSEFNQITRIVEMLGPFPNHMYEKGKQSKHFFDCHQDQYGRTSWRIKTIEAYSKEHNLQEQPSKKYFAADTLPEIIKQYPIIRKGLKEAEVEKEMRNRVAFIDFVHGLLNLDPAQRWTPQQARQHPFILGEPLLQPFVPPPTFKNQKSASTSSSVNQSPMIGSPNPSVNVDPHRPYGGLPPTPQRSATRTYQDAAAYNTHLDQQQGYTQQAQQAAQRAAQISTNPYHDAPASSAYGAAPPRLSIVTSSQHQQQQQQAAYQAFDYSQRAPNASSSTVTNPPPVHHYSTSRGRSNTVGMQDVPPALRKIGHTLGIHAETGQSVTPVLRRDDQWQAWERIHGTGAQGMSRRVSVGRHPQLDFLQEQAESGLVWASPHHRSKGGLPTYASYQSPAQSSQPFSIVVDGHGRDRQQDLFDPMITAPPQAYSTANSSRFVPYGSANPSNAGGGGGMFETAIPFDGYDRNDGASMAGYQPMQPFQSQSNTNPNQPYYASIPTAAMSQQQHHQQQQLILQQQQQQQQQQQKTNIWPTR